MLCCDASLIRVNVAPCMYIHGSTLICIYIYICVTGACAHAQTISRGSWAGGGNHLRRLKELCASYAKPMRQGWDGMGWDGAKLNDVKIHIQVCPIPSHPWRIGFADLAHSSFNLRRRFPPPAQEPREIIWACAHTPVTHNIHIYIYMEVSRLLWCPNTTWDNQI